MSYLKEYIKKEYHVPFPAKQRNKSDLENLDKNVDIYIG
jgi:hypothetical protein